MANSKEKTPNNYDRWEKTCVKFDAPKKTAPKKVKKGK